MNFYIDIHIQPDAEMRENALMNKVFSKFHKALFELKSDKIGVSFPEFSVKLGRILRIHGEHAMLNDLQGMNWIGGLSGYCKVTEIQQVPTDARYRNISRLQSNMTQSKLNRLIKRGAISPERIKLYKAKMFSKGLDNPFLELQSSSNGHKHRRFIQFGNIVPVPVTGEFDLFGLSKTATIPWF